jgi:hypothetical protein
MLRKKEVRSSSPNPGIVDIEVNGAVAKPTMQLTQPHVI